MIKLHTRFIKRVVVLMVLCLFLASSIAFAQPTLPPKSVDNLNDFKEELKLNMLNKHEHFVIQYVGNTDELIDNIDKLIEDVKESDDLLIMSYYKITRTIEGYVGDVNVTFDVTYTTTYEQDRFVKREVEKIIMKTIKSDMTEQEKVRAINDYIANNVEYDWTLQKRSEFDALYYGKAVCQGYSMLTKLMLDEIGIENKIVLGKIQDRHAWNLVKVDGKWYHLDVTNNSGTSKHKYFLVSDKTLKDMGYKWPEHKYPRANSNYNGKEDVVKDELFYYMLNEAEEKVKQSEKHQTDYYADEADRYISKLPECEEKYELARRNQKVRNKIYDNLVKEATSLVERAERDKTEKSINKAQDAVDMLRNSADKYKLQDRLAILAEKYIDDDKEDDSKDDEDFDDDYIDDEEDNNNDDENDNEDETFLELLRQAEKRVKQSERYQTESFAERADKYIERLPECDEKEELRRRNQVVKDKIYKRLLRDAKRNVGHAEKYRTDDWINQAQGLVDKLKDSPEKDELQARLDAIRTDNKDAEEDPVEEPIEEPEEEPEEEPVEEPIEKPEEEPIDEDKGNDSKDDEDTTTDDDIAKFEEELRKEQAEIKKLENEREELLKRIRQLEKQLDGKNSNLAERLLDAANLYSKPVYINYAETHINKIFEEDIRNSLIEKLKKVDR